MKPFLHLERLSGWANYPIAEAEVLRTNQLSIIREYVLADHTLIARGAGKSYGDASLGAHVVSTLPLNRVLGFDATQGIIDCEAGVLLSEILPVIVPQGWFFHVTPGIKSITVGGAIASDVHGKNHPAKGCFSNWLLSFELMLENGDVIRCSAEENSALFWLTCGGMGFTGIILSARFQLMRIASVRLEQKTLQCRDLDAVFTGFETHPESTYAAGWIDTTSSGKDFGRGALFLAEHEQTASKLEWLEKKPLNIPVYAPHWLLNPLSIQIHNELLFRKNRTEEKQIGMDAYFFPLDALKNWNRLYGKRGFVQYQFCVFDASDVQKILEHIAKSRETPFLSVLKRHGPRPAQALNSFPEEGYSLALDFPKTNTILALIAQLDELVWKAGGKIYLTKDACSRPEMGRLAPETLASRKFDSFLGRRIRGLG